MTGVAASRKELATVLKTELGNTYEVLPMFITKVPDKNLVMVGSSKVRRGETHTLRVKEMQVWLVGRKTEPGPGDDAVDAALEAVLAVLDRIPGIVWSEAERGIYADTQPAYTITVTLED